MASISFEFDLQPVLTVRREISAGTWSGAFRKAAKAAQEAHPNQRPRSMVIVLEKVEAAAAAAEPERAA